MRILSWNSNGLKRGGASSQAKANWLLNYMDTHSDLALLAIQETHCQDGDLMAQAIYDMELKYTVIHSPAIDGDEHAGVMLIISKEFEVEDEERIIEGRVMRVRLLNKIYQTNLDIIVVYGYPAGRQPWIHQVTDAVDSPVPTVILGDFNFVRKPQDRSTNYMLDYDIRQTTLSEAFFETLELEDAYRLIHGDKIEFSFAKKSRIDRIYVNESFHGKIKSFNFTTVLGRELDHKMMELEIAEDIELGRGYWKFNTSLLKDNDYTEMIKETIRTAKLELHSGEWDNVADWWEYLKALIRMITINYCKDKEKRRRDYIAVLRREMEILENDIFYNINSENARAQLQEIYSILEKEDARRAEGCRVRARVPNFETSEPSIAYLSSMEKSKGGRNLIYALKDEQGQL